MTKLNLLYISNMEPNKDSGPYWSVPSQVISQSKYDNVFWYNNCAVTCCDWEKTGFYHSNIDYPGRCLSDFPAPFNHPDIIIFEGFYVQIYEFYKQARKYNIPYIVVPRGALTDGTQRKHKWKKFLGNLLFFKKFAKQAKAVHFLTNNEMKDSGKQWNNNYFVLPNGVNLISDKQWHSMPQKETLKGVFIGRISVFHKGLDLLANACAKESVYLRKQGLTIDIYGPDRENDRRKLIQLIKKLNLEDILYVHENSLFGNEKEDILLSSDFFVLTSRMEGHPMGLIEALSYGLPTLVTTGSNMSDEIENSDAGWTALNNSDSIALSLKNLVEGKNSFPQKSKNAIDLAKKYRWDSIALKSHEIYLKLLKVES